jgi:hypothetical protein
VENAGVLTASGLIAGEALTGLALAALAFWDVKLPQVFDAKTGWIRVEPHALLGFAALAVMGYYMIRVPLGNAGKPDEPAPPTAIM